MWMDKEGDFSIVSITKTKVGTMEKNLHSVGPLDTQRWKAWLSQAYTSVKHFLALGV